MDKCEHDFNVEQRSNFILCRNVHLHFFVFKTNLKYPSILQFSSVYQGAGWGAAP